MSETTYKTFVCSYPFEGSHWGFEIKAATFEEADRRIKAMAWAKVDGELYLRIPVPFGGWLHRLWKWFLGR